MKKLIICLGAAVAATCLFLGGYYRGISENFAPYVNYYQRTEELLDTIYNQDAAYFDVLMETDVYYYYECAKDNLNYK